MVSYFVRQEILLQNATEIIKKCDSYFDYNMQQKFITKCVKSGLTVLLQKCDS